MMPRSVVVPRTVLTMGPPLSPWQLSTPPARNPGTSAVSTGV